MPSGNALNAYPEFEYVSFGIADVLSRWSGKKIAGAFEHEALLPQRFRLPFSGKPKVKFAAKATTRYLNNSTRIPGTAHLIVPVDSSRTFRHRADIHQ